jgi:hypothetical protein
MILNHGGYIYLAKSDTVIVGSAAIVRRVKEYELVK